MSVSRLTLLLCLLLCAVAHAQQKEDTKATLRAGSGLDTLRALVDSMNALRSQLDAQNQLARNGTNDTIKDAAKKEAAALQTRLTQAERDFDAIATGIDERDTERTDDLTKFDVVEEMTEMLRPLLREVKAATEQPRLIEQLRADLTTQTRRLAEIQGAVASVQATQAALAKGKDNAADTALKKTLQTTLDKWRSNEKEAKAAAEVVKHRLDDVLSKRRSIWEIVSQATQGFFLTRGRNIVFAVLALLMTLFIWRWGYQWVERFSPWHKKVDGRIPFAGRVIDVLYRTLSALLATAAALTVFYSTGDWLLLGLCLIALVGLVLGARTAIPKYYRHARLLLNFGEVREGERIVYHGLPWLVKSLNMFSELHNPLLRNGRLRVPLDQLAATTSRPLDREETWFPSKEGDWVLLHDGTQAKVVSQTPEFVQLVLLGGTHKSYPTPNFLAQNPQNLAGGFRLTSILRLDHVHRDEAPTGIPSRLTEAITSGVKAELPAEHLRNLATEFRAVTPAALELEIVADFAGDAASRYDQLKRMLQKHALEACNKHQWKLASQVIPLEVLR